MGEFDPKELVLNLASEISERLENEDELLKYLEERSKKSKK